MTKPTVDLEPAGAGDLFAVTMGEWVMVDQHAVAITSGDFVPRDPAVGAAANQWRSATLPELEQLTSDVVTYAKTTAPTQLRAMAAQLGSAASGGDAGAAATALSAAATALLEPTRRIADRAARLVAQIELLLTADDRDDRNTQFTFLGPGGKRLGDALGRVVGRWRAIGDDLGDLRASATLAAGDSDAYLAALDAEVTIAAWQRLGDEAQAFGAGIARLADYAGGALPVATLVQYRNRSSGLALSIPREEYRDNETLWQASMKPISLDAFTVDGRVYFDLVLRGGEYAGWSAVEFDLTSDDLKRRTGELASGAHKIHAVTSYAVAGELRHAILVHKVKLRDPMYNPSLEYPELFTTASEVAVDRSPAEHAADLASYRSRGYMIMSQSFVTTNRGVRVTALYHLYDDDSVDPSSSRAWYDLPTPALTEKIASYMGPPRQLSSYSSGDRRTITAVTLPALYTDKHRFTPDLTPGQLLQRAYSFDRDWYYPVAMTAYRDGGHIRYAVGWGWDSDLGE